MPKGAPRGNQYARKSTRRRGLTVSHYIRADILETLRECVQFETGNGDDEAVRSRVRALLDEAINQDMKRAIALYVQAHRTRV